MLKFRVVYTPRALTESVHWVHGHGTCRQVRKNLKSGDSSQHAWRSMLVASRERMLQVAW
jgi:hypothetical protein